MEEEGSGVPLEITRVVSYTQVEEGKGRTSTTDAFPNGGNLTRGGAGSALAWRVDESSHIFSVGPIKIAYAKVSRRSARGRGVYIMAELMATCSADHVTTLVRLSGSLRTGSNGVLPSLHAPKY